MDDLAEILESVEQAEAPRAERAAVPLTHRELLEPLTIGDVSSSILPNLRKMLTPTQQKLLESSLESSLTYDPNLASVTALTVNYARSATKAALLKQAMAFRAAGETLQPGEPPMGLAMYLTRLGMIAALALIRERLTLKLGAEAAEQHLQELLLKLARRRERIPELHAEQERLIAAAEADMERMLEVIRQISPSLAARHEHIWRSELEKASARRYGSPQAPKFQFTCEMRELALLTGTELSSS